MPSPANVSSQHRALVPVPRVQITRLHLLVLGSLSLAATVWGWFLISERAIGASEEYLLLLGFYAVVSAAFIFSRVKDEHLRFFDIPVFLTILMFVEFGLAPLECFLTPIQLNSNFDGNYVPLIRALTYVTVGMVAFWAGCILIDGRVRQEKLEAPAATQKYGRTRIRVLQWTVGIYAVSFAVKVYLLTHHLYSYLASGDLYFQHLASMQVLMVVSGFGTYALIVACIEKYLRPSDRKWRLVFAVIFASECLWGAISGMKAALLGNFIIVALVASLIQRRFRKGWVIAVVLGMILLYPVSNAYRYLIRGWGEQVTSLASAARVGGQALSRASSASSGVWSEVESGFQSTVSRLDLLQSVGLIISMGPRAKQLLGNERWWMLPFYPFVPRVIWRSKPVLVEGGRFSAALGYGGLGSTWQTVGTSTAPTYLGDLDARAGLAGIAVGMLFLGLVAQWLTNSIAYPVDRRRLFVYAAIFLTATDMEIDAFSFWSGLVKTFAILSVIGWLVYGSRRHSSRTLDHKGNWGAGLNVLSAPR